MTLIRILKNELIECNNVVIVSMSLVLHKMQSKDQRIESNKEDSNCYINNQHQTSMLMLSKTNKQLGMWDVKIE